MTIVIVIIVKKVYSAYRHEIAFQASKEFTDKNQYQDRVRSDGSQIEPGVKENRTSSVNLGPTSDP